MQLWLAERPRLGVNGRQWLFCTLQGGDLSANHVRQMVKLRAAPRLYRAERGFRCHCLGSNGSVTIRTNDSILVSCLKTPES